MEKKYIEFRFYEKPRKEPVLALMGEKWIRDYGYEGREFHFHNLIEVGYCYHGAGEVVINNDSFPYHDNTFTFIPPNCLHTTISTERSQWEWLYFDAKEILTGFFGDDDSRKQFILNDISNKALIASASEWRHFGNAILAVFDLQRVKGEHYREAIAGNLYTIMMYVMRMKGDIWKLNMKTGSKIMPALEFIRRYYSEDIKISELAQHCNLSETHFRRIFQQDMNMTPIEYLNLIRIQAACDILNKNDDYMEEVAVKVGYQSVSAFNRNFRQILGTSPYQWKKQRDIDKADGQKYNVSAKRGWNF